MEFVVCLVRNCLLSETRNCVEGALFPVAAFPLQVGHVHLAPQAIHHLLSEQVVDEGRFDGSVVVHQLQHVTALLIANMVNETCWEAVVASFKASQ
jgi:hypothetical protein